MRNRLLENNQQDKTFLQNVLSTDIPQRAKFSLGVFTGEEASSLTTVDVEGYVTAIDMESGYCQWTNLEGKKMPIVNIDIITLI